MPDEQLDRERFQWDKEKARTELELDRARLGLEQNKDTRESQFLNRNLGVLITAATTILGLVLAAGQWYIAHKQSVSEQAYRDHETEAARLASATEQDRQLSKDLREFVIKYYPDTGASSDIENRFLAGMATFPPDKVAPLLARLSQSAAPEQQKILSQATAAAARISDQTPDAAWCYQERKSNGTYGAYCHLSGTNCEIAKQGSKTATSCAQVSGLGGIKGWHPLGKGLLNSWYQQNMSQPLSPPFPQPD